jgi:hypothetical protein
MTVNNIELLNIVTETQKWLPLLRYKMSSNAVNNEKTAGSSNEVPDIVFHF